MDSTTEATILQAAREIFRSKGFFGAKMDEIAREAGINKALLHYYFRSKQNLFEKVFEEAIATIFPKLISTLHSDLPLDMKIYRLVDYYINTLSKHRDIPLFVLSEIRQNPEHMLGMISEKGLDHSILEKQLQEEAKKGNIRPVSVATFFSNVLGLILFPFITEPIIKGITKMNDQEFDKFLEQRKRELPSMILKTIKSDAI